MHTYVYTHIQCNIIQPWEKKNEILPFITTWMDLKDIMLSEISQGNTIPYYLSYVWNLKINSK